MQDNLEEQLKNYEAIRKTHIANAIPPALIFNPIPRGMKFETLKKPFKKSIAPTLKLPQNLEELAFASIGQLGELVRTRKISSEQLTQMYLGRLKKYGPKLECVVTLTESLAIAQAKRADREIANGKYRCPLHGIPFGAKDLLAT